MATPQRADRFSECCTNAVALLFGVKGALDSDAGYYCISIDCSML